MKKYRPSNGTEGVAFMEHWCFQCERDKNEDCPIIADSMLYDVADEKYPSEWHYPEGSEWPICSEFTPEGRPVLPMARDVDPRQQELKL